MSFFRKLPPLIPVEHSVEKDFSTFEDGEGKQLLVQEAPLAAALLEAFLAQTPIDGEAPLPSCPTKLNAWLDDLIRKLPAEGPRAGLSATAISDSMALLKTVKEAIATSQNTQIR